MTAVAVLDRFSRTAALGLRLRDVATGRVVAGAGLAVTAAAVPGGTAWELARNGSGVWVASRLPGLRGGPGSVPGRTYALAVDDPSGGFLPLRLHVVPPRRGLYAWDGWSALPAGPLAPLRDEPGGEPCPGALPLFPSPARAAPPGCAAISGQLLRVDGGGPAAWALVTVEQDGAVRGLGLADAAGRFAVFMPWPEWPRANLPMPSPPGGSPPPGASPAEPSWEVRVAAFAAPLPPSPVPSLPAIMGQLAAPPRALLASTLSPPEPLGPQPLRFGRPLTLRTGRTPAGPSSFLMVAAA